MKLVLQKRSVQTIILLLFFAIIMCLRAPDVFLYGRFWAEEGNIFFYNAWTMAPLQALFNSFGGYLNLAANASTLIARWFIPLEYAPYFTTLVGLSFQLLPLFLLLSAKDDWLAPFQTRLALTLLLLFVPESIEIALQSLHIQFQLTLCCGIILILKPNHSYQRWLKLFILTLAGLSGLMNIVLVPIYAVRCFIDKNQLRIEEFFALLISCLIQYFFFYEKIASRSYTFFVSDFSNVFFAHELYIPFVGINHYTRPYMNYLHDHMHNLCAMTIPMLVVILFIISICYICYKNTQTRPALFLFTAALFLFGISIIGSLGDRNDFLIPFSKQRYLFISQSLLCIMLAYITYNLPSKKQIIGKVIICWLIGIGGIHFLSYSTVMDTPPENYLSWKQQVQLWKKNPNYSFQLWPSGWVKMTLPIQK